MSTEETKSQTEQTLQLVSFKIGAEEFGVDILRVQEIIRVLEITQVPQSPPHVEGVINLRGKVVPVIDLRSRLGLDKRQHDSGTRIVVVDNDGTVMGMIVDSVSEVLRLPTGSIEPPPDLVAGVDSEFISGVARLEDRLLIHLDLAQVIRVAKDEIEATIP